MAMLLRSIEVLNHNRGGQLQTWHFLIASIALMVASFCFSQQASADFKLQPASANISLLGDMQLSIADFPAAQVSATARDGSDVARAQLEAQKPASEVRFALTVIAAWRS